MAAGNTSILATANSAQGATDPLSQVYYLLKTLDGLSAQGESMPRKADIKTLTEQDAIHRDQIATLTDLARAQDTQLANLRKEVAQASLKTSAMYDRVHASSSGGLLTALALVPVLIVLAWLAWRSYHQGRQIAELRSAASKP